MKETPASNPQKERCPKCGKAIGHNLRAGSITSYLFSAFDCTCARAGSGGEAKAAAPLSFDDAADFCPRCGLRVVANARQGSLSGFLLSGTRCKCPRAEEFADGKMSARFWKLRESTRGTVFSPAADRPKRPAGSYVDLLPGATIGGAYEIIRLIGQGGMGEVYLALHKALAKKCALKVIPPEQVTEEGWRRFQLEAKAVAKLEHVNLVRVTDLGIHEGCLPYYAMDYIDGCNLAEILEIEGPLPLQTVLEIFIQVCDGVEAVHRGGILHRDLKPANIMLSTAGSGAKQAKVLDFGLAKLIGHDRARQSLTVAGDIFGTPYYMSPEQCIGAKLDNRSDIYSLGCTMFECLTGQPPFSGNLASAVIFGHLEGDPPTLESVAGRNIFSESMEIVMAKLLRKNPVERYQSLTELGADLTKVMNGESVRPVYVNRSKRVPDDGSAIAARLEPEAARLEPEAVFKSNIALPLAITLASIALIVFAGISVFYFQAKHSARLAMTTAKEAVTPSVLAGSFRDGQTGELPPAAPLRPYLISCQGGRLGRRIFAFPIEGTLGKLTFLSRNGPVGGCDAIGSVTVQPGVALGLEAGPVFVSHPELLDGFAADDLMSLSFEPGICADEQFVHVARLTALTNLSIKDGALTDKCLDDFNKLINLANLFVLDSGLNGESFAKVKRLPQLRSLTLRVNDPYPAIAKLAHSQTLTTLSLYDCPIGKDEIALIATIPHLDILDLARTQVDCQCLLLLRKFHNMRSLNLDRCPLKPDCINTLKEMQPKTLVIDAAQWPAVARARLRAALPKTRIIYSRQDMPNKMKKELDQSLDDFNY